MLQSKQVLKIFFCCFHIFFTHFSLNLNNIESFLFLLLDFDDGQPESCINIAGQFYFFIKFSRPISIKQIFLIADWSLSFVFLSSKNDTMWQQKRTLKVCLFSLLSNSIQSVFFFSFCLIVQFFLKDVIIQEPSYISSFFCSKRFSQVVLVVTIWNPLCLFSFHFACWMVALGWN